MTSYEYMIKANHDLIKGKEPGHELICEMVNQFLSDRNPPDQAQKYDIDTASKKRSDIPQKRMYPLFFIPPSNGGKLKTILGQTPKTQILSANMYELEILRLLHLFAPDAKEVKYMITETLERLKSTCFGYMDDGVGECFDASLVVLRFLATAAQNEVEWIKSRIENYNRHRDDKKRPWFSQWYYWLCLSELPFAIADPEIKKYKDEMSCLLASESPVANSRQSQLIRPVLLCILCNNLSKYPEYEHLKKHQPIGMPST